MNADPLKPAPFTITSRYYGIPTETLELTPDRTVAYLKRRFLPPTDSFSVIQEHVVVQGDRLDNITAQYLGDPEQFWRICDANNAVDPNALTRYPGQRIVITLPEGIPSYTNPG